CVPSRLAPTPRAPNSPVPSTHLPPVPLSLTQPANPLNCVSTPVVASRAKAATALASRAPTYTCLPSGLMVIARGPPSAFPMIQPVTPVSSIQPAGPLNCVNTPVVTLRVKAATALPRDATYTCLPSGLNKIVTAPSSPRPSAQVTPSPMSATQPAGPLSCVNAPVPPVRTKVATAEL